MFLFSQLALSLRSFLRHLHLSFIRVNLDYYTVLYGNNLRRSRGSEL